MKPELEDILRNEFVRRMVNLGHSELDSVNLWEDIKEADNDSDK